MGRGVITYTAVYILGVTITQSLPAIPFVSLIILAILGILSYIFRKHTGSFIVCSHLALFAAGMCSAAVGNGKRGTSSIARKISCLAETVQQKAAGHLEKLTYTPEAHATLCAISIGEKRFMGKQLKNSYSAAGAMHVLALSGLHIGILFAIVYTLLLPVAALPGGRKARDAIAILFITGYSIFSGCSLSVIRAATMILLYKIAQGKFRNISNWDAIAVSALVIITISPAQIRSIGFQLSYCAVMGIALLFPTCNMAFKQMLPPWKGWKRIIWKGLYWLWCSLSISVCCQIATLPAALFHFGYSAPYFLIANLVAVPLATAILHALALTLCLQWIPVAGDWSIHVLNILISLLNSIVKYISS